MNCREKYFAQVFSLVMSTYTEHWQLTVPHMFMQAAVFIYSLVYFISYMVELVAEENPLAWTVRSKGEQAQYPFNNGISRRETAISRLPLAKCVNFRSHSQVIIERLWLCTIFLILAAFECYMLLEVYALAKFLKLLTFTKRALYGELDI